MNDFTKAAVEPASNASTQRSRYSAGVMKYREMGYWQPDYVPKDTDVIALFRLQYERATAASTKRRAAAMA